MRPTFARATAGRQETRNCQNCKNQFTIESEDFAFYEKIKVPPPTFCPACRFERRIAYRNERKLFWNKNAASGERLLTIYPVQSGVAVYAWREWISDEWDGLTYGREYDFSKSFFEQFHELAKAVPHNACSNEASTNTESDYTANASHLKNCYLVFNGNYLENCAYGNAFDYSKECFEASYTSRSELSYESFWNLRCYQTHYSSQCEDCANVWMSRSCTGCTDCFGCVNLRGKSLHIFNQPYTKEEYRKRLEAMRLNTWTGLQAALRDARMFWTKNPLKFIQGVQNNNVTGEYVTNSKNVHRGYFVVGGENLRYCQYQGVPPNKDCADITIWGGGNELCYENSICGWGMFNSKFCAECWPGARNSEYSMFLRNCSDCFGCVGLRNKQYCILNKQNTKEEYLDLREKIIAHMDEKPYVDQKGSVYRYGEFFPIAHAPFGHNTSLASEYFPLLKEEAVRQGYPWDESEAHEYETTMAADDLPDAIEDVEDGILSQIIACASCKRAYRIVRMELDFLRREHIPLPRFCAECRHRERVAQRNGFRIFRRTCSCKGLAADGGYKNTGAHFHGAKACPNAFETSYASDRPEIVYCESCYNAEVA